jgi:hypothetical protein
MRWSALNPTDREEALAFFSVDAIDSEFLPFIHRINSLPFAVTVQSCIGHLSYWRYRFFKADRPPGATKNWGYLQLMIDLEAAHELCRRAHNWPWLWKHGSRLFLEGAPRPEITRNGAAVIGLAWDAASWPTPGNDITDTLEQMGE